MKKITFYLKKSYCLSFSILEIFKCKYLCITPYYLYLLLMVFDCFIGLLMILCEMFVMHDGDGDVGLLCIRADFPHQSR